MHCPKCGKENPEGARFCLKCGTGLVLVCPQCGIELPPDPDLGFCFACGAEVSASPVNWPPPPTGSAAERLQRLVPREYAERLLATRGQVAPERRTVTILFSDVKGSTAMAESLDPEDVMEIMDGAFDVLIEPVYRYEGTLARLMGDAVLAFFGAPLAHEDDAQRACLAALDIISAAQKYAARLEQERGITGFDVRVGIHTGLVVVGEVGSDLRVEYTAMGDAINLAARMETAAEPGAVLVSEATHKLVAPLFETEALGSIEVKGRREAVPVYRVLAARPAAGKVRGIAGLESPLVGREAEFRALQAAVERLHSGEGGIVTVVGEAGIGKSRLVAEVRKQTTVGAQVGAQHAAPLQWIEGRCLSYGASIAYLLWIEFLRGLLGVSVDDAPAEVESVLRARLQVLCPARFNDVHPYLARLMSLPLPEEIEKQLEDLDGRERRDRTFRAVETLIACTVRQGPLVLVCEDLHWADPTSLQLLEQLLPLTKRNPLLLICVFRPRREHPSWRLRETATQEDADRHTDLCLEPLSSTESQALVANLLTMDEPRPELAEGVPGALKARILSRAEGNPFYLEEILRSLIDQGAIVQDRASGHWQVLMDVEQIHIPDTLQGVLVARIDRLQEETRRVLQLASVIGRIFLYRILAEIAAAEAATYEELHLDRRLGTLKREELIRERARLPELEYIFKHELTREAAYNGLLKRERRAFHRQVAEALERLFPERVEEQMGLLAYHWEQAGDAEKATAYLLQAGDQARLAYAHQEAVDYYQRALAFLEEQGDDDRAARTLMKLGLTHHNAFQFQQARAVYETGFALWQQAARIRDEAPPPPAPHALRVGGRKLDTLDLSLVAEVGAANVMNQLFSGLVAHGPDMDVVPDVAQKWEVLEGGRRYTFHLRDDVLWSDGVPLTAVDFEYAWKRALDPAINSPNAQLLYDIKGARAFHQGQIPDPVTVAVSAPDNHTLAVELEGPTGYFVHLLAHIATFPLPRHALARHGKAWTEAGKLVSNGPFRLEAGQPGEAIVLVRNPRYHGRFRGNLQEVEFCVLAEEEDYVARGLEMYGAGGLDLFALTSPPQADEQIRQRYAGEYISFPLLNTFYVGFDVRRPPFSDVRVRQAFVLATDRAGLADVALLGYPVPAAGGFLPPGMPGHSPEIGLPYDPEQARQLLADAGYPGGRGLPPLTMVAPQAAPQYLEEYLRAHWRENLGIEVQWEGVAWIDLWDRLQTEQPPLHFNGWVGDLPDPDNFLRVAVQLQVASYAGWRHQAYERLVEEARRVMDQAERIRLYRQAEQILVEEAPIMPVAYGRRQGLVKPWVKQLSGAAIGSFSLKDVILEPH